jgi:hypothetical protein
VELPGAVRVLLAKLTAGRTDPAVSVVEWALMADDLTALLPVLTTAERRELGCLLAELVAEEFGVPFECSALVILPASDGPAKRARAVEKRP